MAGDAWPSTGRTAFGAAGHDRKKRRPESAASDVPPMTFGQVFRNYQLLSFSAVADIL